MVDVIRSGLEKSLKTKLFESLSGETELDRKLADCAGCKRPVMKSQYNGYLVYMDRYYHLDCLARTLQGLQVCI